MIGLIRRIKLTYILYNLFHRNSLKHNVRLYRKLGLKKFYFSPVSSKDFEKTDASKIIDSQSLPALESTALYNELNETSKSSLRDFDSNGYAVLKNYVSGDQANAINAEIDKLLKNSELTFKYKNKIMFAIHKSQLLKGIGEDKKLLELLNALIQDEMHLFQSINFIVGSEQKTHSDSIHMTTYPLGGLLGVWIALDDIDLDNGPLHYYPGSHKLPYYLNSDYDNVGNAWMIGSKDYSAYENMIEQKLKENPMGKQIFTAKKGDLFIWHANLFHGGEPHTNKNKTRKSVVFHYYAINRICYHEITQRPALMK